MAKKKTAAKRKPPRAPELAFIAEDLRPLAVPIGTLKLDPRNARTHSPENLAAIAASLRTYGQVKPVVANRRNGEIIAGNGTYLAASQLGWSHLAVVWGEYDEKSQRGFSIADNRTAELAGWDDGLLLQQIDLIDQETPDLAAALQLAELKQSLDGAEDAKGGDGHAPEPQTDRAEELRKKWQTETGQLWVMPGKAGEHRLLCGDARKQPDLERVIERRPVTLLITDPPYGTGGWRRARTGQGSSPRAFKVQEKWDEWPCAALRMILPPVTAVFALDLEPAYQTFTEYPTKRLRFWKKPDPRPSLPGRIVDAVEPVLVCSQDATAMMGNGENWFEASTPRANRDTDATGHPYQKPVTLLAWLIEPLAPEGALLYDPFLGSGTTMVAAEQLGRICYGIEIEPKYVAVSLQRLADMGLKPSLAPKCRKRDRSPRRKGAG